MINPTIIVPPSVVCGDNLTILRNGIADESVDLIYLDPPFNSNADYLLLAGGGKGKLASREKLFCDSWRWDATAEKGFEECLADDRLTRTMQAFQLLYGNSDTLAYLTMMAPRLLELYRVLKPTGTLYLHCDRSASAPLTLLLSGIFSRENHLGTIVWCYGLGGSSKRRWAEKHDDILWFAKDTANYYFTPEMIPAESNKMRGLQKKAPDYWLIPSINNMARERTGYPTQKPLALLDRIIRSSSREGDIVLDPFCGSGTTLVSAYKLGRRYIGIDQNPQALEICRYRLAEK